MARQPSVARPQPADEPAVGADLPHFSATRLATDMGAVTREVMRRGAAVITRHESPAMVLVSIDRYAELERGSAPDLHALSARFDALYAHMQEPGVAESTLAGLGLSAPAREPASTRGGKASRNAVTAPVATARARRRK